MAIRTLTPITIADAEVKAKVAADVVINNIHVSVSEHVKEIFESEGDQSEVIQKSGDLLEDEEFRGRLASAFIAWLMKTSLIMPPSRLES